MSADAARRFGHGLVVVHAVLGLWAVVGFAEWFWPATPWPRVSNVLFPRGILFLQWLLVLAAAAVFLGGYLARWRGTPAAMAVVYAAMASLCAVETFGYLEGRLRFAAMVAEYAAYVGILVFLFRWRRFGPAPRPAADVAMRAG